MSGETIGLTEVSDPDLEHLLQNISSGSLACPLTAAGLARTGLSHLKIVLPTLGGHDANVTRLVLSAVLAERRSRRPAQIDLVWTEMEATLCLTPLIEGRSRDQEP